MIRSRIRFLFFIVKGYKDNVSYFNNVFSCIGRYYGIGWKCFKNEVRKVFLIVFCCV